MAKKTSPKGLPKKATPRAKRVAAKEPAVTPTPSPESVEPTSASAPSLDQIRERAFQIFRAGANPSDPVADWFQAERELRGGEART
jgi:hypothetical protein